MAAQTTPEDCRVPADPDISGLGVRLGLYFQLASNIVLSTCRPSESLDSLLPTELFFTGSFIAVICSVTTGHLPLRCPNQLYLVPGRPLGSHVP